GGDICGRKPCNSRAHARCPGADWKVARETFSQSAFATGERQCFPPRMLGNLIGPEIKELIDERNFAALREAFTDWSPADVAECITELPEEEQAVVFRLL